MLKIITQFSGNLKIFYTLKYLSVWFWVWFGLGLGCVEKSHFGLGLNFSYWVWLGLGRTFINWFGSRN
jgi:hypothetical protein